MNKFIGIGRLVKDPEVRYPQGEGTVVGRYTLAIDRMGQDKGADFINCVCFGKAAEFVEKYLSKGTKVAIEGRVQTGQYQNKDGKTVYTTDVVVSNHEFCERKSDAQESPKPSTDADGFMNIPDSDLEELPF